MKRIRVVTLPLLLVTLVAAVAAAFSDPAAGNNDQDGRAPDTSPTNAETGPTPGSSASTDNTAPPDHDHDATAGLSDIITSMDPMIITLSASCSDALTAIKADAQLSQCLNFPALIAAFKGDAEEPVVTPTSSGGPPAPESSSSVTTPGIQASAPTSSTLGSRFENFLQSVCTSGTACNATALQTATSSLVHGCTYDELSFDGPPTHLAYVSLQNNTAETGIDLAGQENGVWVNITHADGRSTLAYIDPSKQKGASKNAGNNLITGSRRRRRGEAEVGRADSSHRDTPLSDLDKIEGEGPKQLIRGHRSRRGAAAVDWHGGMAAWQPGGLNPDAVFGANGNLVFSYLNDANIVYFTLVYYDSIRSVGCLSEEGSARESPSEPLEHARKTSSLPAPDAEDAINGTLASQYCAVRYLEQFSAQQTNMSGGGGGGGRARAGLTISDLRPLIGASEGGNSGYLEVKGFPAANMSAMSQVSSSATSHNPGITTLTSLEGAKDAAVGSKISLPGGLTGTTVQMPDGTRVFSTEDGSPLSFGTPGSRILGAGSGESAGENQQDHGDDDHVSQEARPSTSTSAASKLVGLDISATTFCTPCNKAYYTQLLYALQNDTVSSHGSNGGRVLRPSNSWQSGGPSFTPIDEGNQGRDEAHKPCKSKQGSHSQGDNTTATAPAWAGEGGKTSLGTYIAEVATTLCGTGWLDGTIPRTITVSTTSSGQSLRPLPIGPLLPPLFNVTRDASSGGGGVANGADATKPSSSSSESSMSSQQKERRSEQQTKSNMNMLVAKKRDIAPNPPTDDPFYCSSENRKDKNITYPKDPYADGLHQTSRDGKSNTNVPIACQAGSKDHTDDTGAPFASMSGVNATSPKGGGNAGGGGPSGSGTTSSSSTAGSGNGLANTPSSQTGGTGMASPYNGAVAAFEAKQSWWLWLPAASVVAGMLW